jgi:hypothetical protein
MVDAPPEEKIPWTRRIHNPKWKKNCDVKTRSMTVTCLERTTTTISGFENAEAPKPKLGSLDEGKPTPPVSAVEMALEPEEMTDAEMKKRAWGTGSAEMYPESERLAAWDSLMGASPSQQEG